MHAADLVRERTLVLSPQPKCPWANEMVLNPAIIEDPNTAVLHMLFRATGPFPELQQEEAPLPYPIVLGYGWSKDRGKTWEFDLSRPALAPHVEYERDKLVIKNGRGEETIDYANGCIEDPRLFFLEDECYVTVACRLFPPGPYWIHDDPVQCAPSWVKGDGASLGRAATENVTVNVLFKVDLVALHEKRYEDAFRYITHLTDPEKGENRDVIIFPRRLNVSGNPQYVCLHRPWESDKYSSIGGRLRPSIAICAADDLYTLWKEEESQEILASPLFDWEEGRIGASANVLEISPGEWLLSYHGKKDSIEGYTQSFMILKEQAEGLPVVAHRCSERILYPVERWEMPGRFKTPVVFVTGMIALGDELLVSYGAADERVGVARLDLPHLIEYLRGFDALGRRTR